MDDGEIGAIGIHNHHGLIRVTGWFDSVAQDKGGISGGIPSLMDIVGLFMFVHTDGHQWRKHSRST